jgi:DNA repair protein RadC
MKMMKYEFENMVVKYPTKRYIRFEKIVREKVDGGYFHIPEACNDPIKLYDTIITLTDIARETQEVVGVLSLNAKLKVIGCDIIHRGTVDASLVSPRDVFKAAITTGAAKVALFHNHPSGDSTKSIEDEKITECIRKAGELIGIPIVDHIIIGDGEFYSILADKKYFTDSF